MFGDGHRSRLGQVEYSAGTLADAHVGCHRGQLLGHRDNRKLLLPLMKNSGGSSRHLWRAALGGRGGPSERIVEVAVNIFQLPLLFTEPSTHFLLH